VAALAGQIGVTVVTISVLKNQRAKAVRFSTVTALRYEDRHLRALSGEPDDCGEPPQRRDTTPPRRRSG
jgi:hypothetical protein